MSKLTKRFWLECSLAVVSGAALIVTLIWPRWIEMIFGVEPDVGNGSAEWGVTIGLAVFTTLLVTLARREWSRSYAK
ncbi:ABC transporter permease [Paraburkholderia sp. MM5384-R2]|uniref:ABC transporter permease n=1 Tax=Paraburkholderia sp. MM5384-R2 TaxID=2723097 RepID=UPI001613B193|nr:ABC transporter permease [Paraburkholderia sp. MM5384-R2]MBB5502185.1 hypothetical protein [Paraburkholderia sp. MM5384-R2]